MHFGGKFIKQKLQGTPNLEGVGYPIGPQIQFWKDLLQGEFITQKLLGTPNLVGVGLLIGPQIQIWKDLGPV